MKRHIVIASHSTLAKGMTEALKLFEGNDLEITTLSAYVDNKPIENQIKEIMEGFPEDDEVVIMTDLLGGSVNQKFFPYVMRPHTHLIAGMNLPLAMSITMDTSIDYLTEADINKFISDSQDQIKYVNAIAMSSDEDDEDE